MSDAEQFTEEEKSIMRQLERTPRKLRKYQMHLRTSQNVALLDAVNAVPILNFKNTSENLIMPVNDKITMKDLRCLERKIPDEETEILGKGAIQFLIWRIADNQNSQLKQQTYIFPLNFCHIEDTKRSTGSLSTLAAEFDTIWRRCQPTNIFEKRILLFPVFSEGQIYLTMVENPRWAVEKQNKWQREACVMVHLGTGDLDKYQSKVGRKAVKILELAAKFTGSERNFKNNQKHIETVARQLPDTSEADRPFLMLYFLNRILTYASEFPDWERVVDEFDKERARFDRDLICHRNRLSELVSSAIEAEGTKAAKHLVKQRARIVQFQTGADEEGV